MVALSAMVKTGKERAGKQGGADHAAANWPHEANAPHHYYMLSTSTSWPLDQCQEDHELPYPIHKSDHTPSAAAAPPPHTLSAVHPYSLSSAHHATSHSRRSAISSSRSPSSHTSSAHSLTTFSPTLSTLASPPMTSLWDADEDHVATELPPIDPCDHLKTLLTQLASCISSLTTAYAHQQAALISHHMRARDAEESGRHAAPDVIPATDEAMVSELHTLSNLHSQLALLPHVLSLKDACPDAKEQDSMAQALQLKQYEGIIARFHDEIWKKNAVTEALKDTLAKSMLRGRSFNDGCKLWRLSLVLM